MAAERKPLVAMESREPHSIRFTPTEWDAICGVAAERGLEPAVLVRKIALIGIEDVMRYSRAEASLGIPAIGGGGSQRIRRF